MLNEMSAAHSFNVRPLLPIRLLLWLVLLVLPGLATATPPALPDQFGASHSLSDFAGQPVLAIVASRRKLRWIGKWEEALRPELPQLNSIRIADITDEPRPDMAKVAAVLQQRAPADISILIDLQNHWATAYELDTKEPCLVLFDSNHKVVAKFRGRPKGKLVDEVMTALRVYFPAEVAS
jgi:hypothetical protein